MVCNLNKIQKNGSFFLRRPSLTSGKLVDIFAWRCSSYFPFFCYLFVLYVSQDIWKKTTQRHGTKIRGGVVNVIRDCQTVRLKLVILRPLEDTFSLWGIESFCNTTMRCINPDKFKLNHHDLDRWVFPIICVSTSFFKTAKRENYLKKEILLKSWPLNFLARYLRGGTLPAAIL